MKKKYSLSDFDFSLPENLIAQHPAEKRDSSKLYLLDRNSKKESRYDVFSNILQYLKKGDLLVFNNARVVPARIFALRETGARVEIVLARMLNKQRWLIITNKTKKLKAGEKLISELEENFYFTVIKRSGEYIEAEPVCELDDDLLKRIGTMPLPPYIKRKASESDNERYQTVYARKSGAVAAPTAGLHFTEDLLHQMETEGIERTDVTLYVSWGTFAPVRGEDISAHDMHTETYELTEAATEKINNARSEGRRIIAVGTTSLRVLESSFSNGKNHAGVKDTNIFIYPPGKVHSVDGLITNFHTPKSTLLMLVCAFAGYDNIMKAYKDAVEKNFRFFSYGDSMFIV